MFPPYLPFPGPYGPQGPYRYPAPGEGPASRFVFLLALVTILFLYPFFGILLRKKLCCFSGFLVGKVDLIIGLRVDHGTLERW